MSNVSRFVPAVKGRYSAFTLIELLVVVAIISLLIAILLPSLDSARATAKRAVCATNLKGIGSASRVYEADDYNGWGIPVHPFQFEQCSQQPGGGLCPSPSFIGAYEWGGKSGIGQTDFVGGNPNDPNNSKYGTKAGFGPPTRAMNNIIYGTGFTDFRFPTFNRDGAAMDAKMNLDAYRCPGDNGPPRGGHCADWLKYPERSSYDHFGNSYAANVFMVSISTGGPMYSNSPYMRPVTRVPTPSRTIYYEENIGRWAWAAKTDVCPFLTGVDVGKSKTLAGWHKGDWTYNRVFVDTHVEYQRIYIDKTEDALGFANHYRSEKLDSYPDWVDVPGPEDFDFYQCVIIRGNGWQKDTLPANQIATGLLHTGGGRPSYEKCVTE